MVMATAVEVAAIQVVDSRGYRHQNRDIPVTKDQKLSRTGAEVVAEIVAEGGIAILVDSHGFRHKNRDIPVTNDQKSSRIGAEVVAEVVALGIEECHYPTILSLVEAHRGCHQNRNQQSKKQRMVTIKIH